MNIFIHLNISDFINMTLNCAINITSIPQQERRLWARQQQKWDGEGSKTQGAAHKRLAARTQFILNDTGRYIRLCAMLWKGMAERVVGIEMLKIYFEGVERVSLDSIKAFL